MTLRTLCRHIEKNLLSIVHPVQAYQETQQWVEWRLGLSSLERVLQAEMPIDLAVHQWAEDFLYQRIQKHKPLARQRGTKFFWKHDFLLNADTLDPRPESEGLIELIMQKKPNAESIIDLGTGTGCLLLSLLWELPSSHGIGLDIEKNALSIAQKNSERLGVKQRVSWCCGGWENCPLGPFDCIVSNPPYVSADDLLHLMPEVLQWDPLKALDGGKDGLLHYRCIIPLLKSRLVSHGLVAFEIGDGQGALITHMLKDVFNFVVIFQDLCQKDRYILASDQPFF